MEIKENMIESYGLSEQELAFTTSSFRPESLARKQFFLKVGQTSDKIAYVLKGMLRSYLLDEDENQITTQFFPAGTLVISFESFNEQVPSKEYIIAEDDCELLVITYEQQMNLYQEVPKWQEICKDMASRNSHEQLERAVEFQTMTATERYQKFCDDHPEVLQTVALRHIASYLGIDNATLSRIRRKK
ncbi:MAG: Crp/Fnr family transcriptional regulator [Bacteroidetes bacterium]|nr:MAG: Crp/Fnr family transcriptional regulator [Bacteroidota bacterium]